MYRFIILITILVLALAILFSIIENTQYVSLPKSKYLGPIQGHTPVKSDNFGRYTKPFDTINYSWVSSSKLFNFATLKHWDFKSISTSKYFLAVAIANFNYIATAFVYLIDRNDQNKQFYQYTSKSIFARAIKEQAKSSIDGCTQFYQFSSEFIRFCYNKSRKAYEIDATIPINNDLQMTFDFQMEYSNERDQSMALVYPVEENRPVYTHKIAALPSRGKIQIGNTKQEDLVNGLGSIDWTLGYPERVCRWKWISLSGVGTNSSNNESVAIGINLSDLVYNDVNGISMESAIWIAGQVYTMDKLIFQLPEDQYLINQVWQIYSSETADPKAPKLHLNFQPWGSQEEHINAFILQGDFVQAFGVYNGTIELFDNTYVIENGFGVAENHRAKW